MVGRWEREGVLPRAEYRQKLCELYGKKARELGFVKPGEVPIWNVPYRRNPFFTGREATLSELHQLLMTTRTASLTQPQAMSGLGGIGKTQVALEYAYRYGEEYQAVLWVRAESREVLILDFAALAPLLSLPEQHAHDHGQAIDAVKKWLASLSCWLMILDNVEDLRVVSDFIPLTAQGHVLLTTRSQATGPIAHLIDIDVMDVDEGVLFLLRRAGVIGQEATPDAASYTDRVSANAIAQAMSCLPLALDQAGAYIQETQCHLTKYLQLSETHRSALLKARGALALDHPESVVSTFLLAFEKVQQVNSAAADLLQLCVFLHPDAIPEEIIIDGAAELGPNLAPVATDPLLLDSALKDLLKYSLVRRNREAQTLTVHRLVQAVHRDSMAEAIRRQWVERAVRAVNRAFPDMHFANWSRYERCLPQVQVCAALIQQEGLAFAEAARLFDQAGCYLEERGQYAEAEPLLRQALVIRQHVLGENHPDTAQSLHNLAINYWDLINYAEAEALLRQALVIRQQTLGEHHPLSILTLNDLAVLFYSVLQNYTEAEPLLQQVLVLRRHVLGEQHADTAQSFNNLAVLYRIQGKYEEAELLALQSLMIFQRVLGEQHPDTAQAYNNLALLYWYQGKYGEAEPLYQQALIIYEHLFGPQHVSTITVLNNLGRLYYMQGNYTEAEPRLQQALAVREQTLGSQHPDTAQSLNNVGLLYYIQGNHAQAELLLQRALSIRERVLGSDNLLTAQSLHSLGILYTAQGKYGEVEPLYQQALHIREIRLGPEHPETAEVLQDLAALHQRSGYYGKAEAEYERALTIHERVFGAQHPKTVATRRHYNELLRDMGQKNAIEIAEASLPEQVGTEEA